MVQSFQIVAALSGRYMEVIERKYIIVIHIAVGNVEQMRIQTGWFEDRHQKERPFKI